jgi:hypothetical protein
MNGPIRLWRTDTRPSWRAVLPLLMLPVAAASAAVGDAAAPNTGSQKPRTEEIVVTAQKRAE